MAVDMAALLPVFWSAFVVTVNTGMISDVNLFGKEFMILFHNTSDLREPTILRISNPKVGQFTIAVQDSRNPANESNATALSLDLRHLCEEPLFDQDDVCLVTVSSSDEMEVLVINGRDGQPYYNSVPSSKLGMDYFTETRFIHKFYMCDILIVQPSTNIQFSLKQFKNVSFDGKLTKCLTDLCSFTVLKRTSVIKLKSNGDFSGLRISGDKPFALFCGGQTGETNSSVILNQLLPVGMYGLSYVTWTTLYRGFVIVLAACDHTDVYISGVNNITFQNMASGSLQEHYVEAKHRVMIQSNKPVAVVQSWRQFGTQGNMQKTILLPLVSPNKTCSDDYSYSQTDYFTSTLSASSAILETMSSYDLNRLQLSLTNDDVKSTPQQCQCMTSASYLKPEELRSKLEQLSKNNLLDKNNLSRSLRKRTSATDNRPTAKSIGIIGALVLCGVVAFIVVIDFPNLVDQVKLFRQRKETADIKTKKYDPNLCWKKTMVKQFPESDPRLNIIEFQEDEC